MKQHLDAVISALSSSYPCFGCMHCLSEVNGILERRMVCEHPSYVYDIRRMYTTDVGMCAWIFKDHWGVGRCKWVGQV